MLRQLIHSLAATVAFAALTGLAPAEAHAPYHDYAVATLHNPMTWKITFEYRWGAENDWTRCSLEPHESTNLWYPIDDEGHTPFLFIRFDDTFDDGEITWKGYRLEPLAVSSPRSPRGSFYVFRSYNYDRNLALYRIR